MAALVQSFPQPSSTSTMLQTRPSSASGMLQTSQNQMSHYGQTSANSHRNSYQNLSAGSNTYRGHTTNGPIAPYAFTSTPALTGYRQPQAPFFKQDQRTASAPAGVPTMNALGQGGHRLTRYPAPVSVSTTTSSSSSEAAIPATKEEAVESLRAQAFANNGAAAASGSGIPTKVVPERYRRTANRKAEAATSTSGSSTTSYNVQQLQSQLDNAFGTQSPLQQQAPGQGPQALAPNFNSANTPIGSRGTADDMFVQKHARLDSNRRRSIHTIEGYGESGQFSVSNTAANQHPLRSSPVVRPASSSSAPSKPDHGRSLHRISSSLTTAPKLEVSGLSTTNNPALKPTSTLQQERDTNISIPIRNSSSNATKQTIVTSPLSKPATMSADSTVTKDSFASTVNATLNTSSKNNAPAPTSPAAQHLTALNDRGGKKPSRLRRAFSFGSAAEFRKAAAEGNNDDGTSAMDRARLKKERYQDEREAEQARIAQRQEEGGIGSGIYSGQGNFFSGSTDNLSISSTASSASIMIRKMGKGMKRSTRSLVGLFRPKSVIGVPAADSAIPEPSVGPVALVTVEAERQRVNVTDVRDHTKGGTGFPMLQRNSIDAVDAVLPAPGIRTEISSRSSVSSDPASRKSVIGGEKERAEILAAVRKGILKRSGTDSSTSSPTIVAVDGRATLFDVPRIPGTDDSSPQSSAPSTPIDDNRGHQRNVSVSLNGDDYFTNAVKFGVRSTSVPVTPATRRNISFKNTISRHDTWASTEYDRRGEIATCNRLTPMLAQQIKEELNSFKMEMEVHENSKIYTHFF